jgi:hypothetical protein
MKGNAVERPNTFFRGSELPRLLLLLVILIVGMVAMWKYLYFKAFEPEPEAVATVPLTPIERDKSVEFETVKDKTAINLRDMAAYKLLIAKAEDTKPLDLDKKSRRDVLTYQIFERPEHYRGVPIHILGSALRVLTYDTPHAKKGRLYEAWTVTSDSQHNPYVCVFEDAPNGFPIGDNISERIVFNGYFLKMMAYEAGSATGKKEMRIAPVLIGRIGWTPHRAAPGVGNRTSGPFAWMAIAVAIMFVISFFRWMTGLQRSLRVPSRSRVALEHPNDQIEPEKLAAWLENVDEVDAETEEPPR